MYGELSGSAARLLLVYRDKNVSRMKRETIMSRSGIKTTKGFYDSRKELEMKGFIKVTRSKGLPSTVELFSIGMSDQRERLTTEEEIKIEIETILEKYNNYNNLINILYYYINGETPVTNIHHSDGVCNPQDGPTSQTNSTDNQPENYVTSIPQYTTGPLGDIPQYTSEQEGSISQYTSSDVPVYPSIPDQYTPEHSPKSTGIPQYTSDNEDTQRKTVVDWQRVQGIWKTTFPYTHALKKPLLEELLGLVNNDVDLFQSELNRIQPFADKKCKPNSPYSYVKKSLNGSGVGGKQGLKDGGRYNETSSENTLLNPSTHYPVDNSRLVEYNSHVGTEELPDPSPELLAKADEYKRMFEQMKTERGWQE